MVIDTTPCTYGMTTCRPYLSPENQKKFDQLKTVDGTGFVHDVVLPRLTITGVPRRWRSTPFAPPSN